MTTPAPTALVSTLAKDWVLEVNTGPDAATPTWTPVRGLTKIAPSIEDSSEDDSDFDSDGWGSDTITQRKWKVEFRKGLRKRAAGVEEFTPDPGQEALRLGEVIGFDANVLIRWYRKDGAPDAFTGYASVSYGGGGGGVKDLEPFSGTLNGQGARTQITNPTA